MERHPTFPKKDIRSQAVPRGLATLYAAAQLPYRKLKKSEHLCRKLPIDHLFAKNAPDLLSTTCFPLRALCRPVPEALQTEGQPCVEVLFSVSKRSFKRAVRRNRAKRQMREAYRLLRHDFMETAASTGLRYSLAFVWMGKSPHSTAQVARAMGEVLARLNTRLQGSRASSQNPSPDPAALSGETAPAL